jgi:hypothetical protein
MVDPTAAGVFVLDAGRVDTVIVSVCDCDAGEHNWQYR